MYSQRMSTVKDENLLHENDCFLLIKIYRLHHLIISVSVMPQYKGDVIYC